jgi:hypothetical protein
MKRYTLEEGRQLVKAARNSIEIFISTANFRREAVEATLSGFDARHGVFVTLYHYPTRTLRGCIGFTEGVKPIKRLIVDAAVAAAAEDPRFVPVMEPELDRITVEVSVLSDAERIRGEGEALKDQIRIGTDGLIIEYGYHRGLLLPIVAVEQGWGAEEFLNNLCVKAGLQPHMWKQHGVLLYRFTTQVFTEVEPRGRVEEVKSEMP